MTLDEGLKKIDQHFRDASASKRKITYNIEEQRDGIWERRGGRWERQLDLSNIIQTALTDGTEQLRITFFVGGAKSNRAMPPIILDFVNSTTVLGSVPEGSFGVSSNNREEAIRQIRQQVRAEMQAKHLSDSCAMQEQTINKLRNRILRYRSELAEKDLQIKRLKRIVISQKKKLESEKTNMTKTLLGLAGTTGAAVVEKKFGVAGFTDIIGNIVQVFIAPNDNGDDDDFTDPPVPPSARIVEDDADDDDLTTSTTNNNNMDFYDDEPTDSELESIENELSGDYLTDDDFDDSEYDN